MSVVSSRRSDTRVPNQAASSLVTALESAGANLARLPGRAASSGLHEVKELGPALRCYFQERVSPSVRVELSYALPIADWNRPTTQVDLVVLARPDNEPRLAAELKVWDIGHQLFDLAKVSCLLTAGVPSGFLVCVARSDGHFERRPGGVVFPKEIGTTRRHSFTDLIEDHRDEWRHHVGKGGPGPRALPAEVTTTTICQRRPDRRLSRPLGPCGRGQDP